MPQIGFAVAGLILLGAVGCGGENSESVRARALLARIAEVDLSATPKHRERQLTALAELKLAEPALAELRDRCLRAHSGLLAAEREQALTTKRLASVGQVPLTEAELVALKARVAHAAELLRNAQAELPACERGTRELAIRYR